jgi:Flp pilus assembly pilin Flp
MIETVWDRLDRLRRTTLDGQGLVEYALILAFVSITALAALGIFAAGVTSLISVSL